MNKLKHHHNLKIQREIYWAIESEAKKAITEYDNGEFKVGDTLAMHSFSIATGKSLGKSVNAVITHVWAGGYCGLSEDYCMISFELVKNK